MNNPRGPDPTSSRPVRGTYIRPDGVRMVETSPHAYVALPFALAHGLCSLTEAANWLRATWRRY